MTEKKKTSTIVIVIIVLTGLLVFGCCIFSVLASVAVPNFLEAQVRAKVSRARADMRILSTAVEAYAVDYNRYPGAMDSSLQTRDLAMITTPIAYVANTNMTDPFTDVGESLKFYRFSNRNSDLPRYIFYSVGPNIQNDLPLDSAGRLQGINFRSDLVKYEYDPSNGTISTGNLIHYGN